MCGILGCIGLDGVPKVLHAGLERLEYRGYDSAGIAVAHDKHVHVDKQAGRVDGLAPDRLPTTASAGIAHTRWATHGPPTTANAHPHTGCDGKIAIVHNGIVENHADLRDELEDRGHTFTSETDTEVVAHLLEETYEDDLSTALQAVTRQLEGSYAILATHADEPDTIVGVRNQSPLVAGVAAEGLFLASDVVAFRPHTDRVVYLEDGDVARIGPHGLDVATWDGRPIEVKQVPWELEEATKSGFPHFMLKEIHEQPRALREALMGRTKPGKLALEGNDNGHPDVQLDELADEVDELIFIGCGSSYNAAKAASHTFERHAQLPTRVERSSEFTPRSYMTDRAAVVAVTQSGETADTLRALEAANRVGFTTIAVTNTNGSTATRTANAWLPIRAGPEISVAATKTFTSQLMALRLLATQLAAAGANGADANRPKYTELLDALQDVPARVQARLDDLDEAKAVGRWLAGTGTGTGTGTGSDEDANADADTGPSPGAAGVGTAADRDPDTVLVLGRGAQHAVAEEAALKIKEISYVHAEAFAMGELKHGPLALVEDGTPVIAFDSPDLETEQILSSLKEAAARGAEVVVISGEPDPFRRAGFTTLETSGHHEAFDFEASLLGQIIAYEAATQRGCNVDKPRNLAKSVTVE